LNIEVAKVRPFLETNAYLGIQRVYLRMRISIATFTEQLVIITIVEILMEQKKRSGAMLVTH
jgi:hypothetical protein